MIPRLLHDMWREGLFGKFMAVVVVGALGLCVYFLGMSAVAAWEDHTNPVVSWVEPIDTIYDDPDTYPVTHTTGGGQHFTTWHTDPAHYYVVWRVMREDGTYDTKRRSVDPMEFDRVRQALAGAP